jgi:hypothetical protein
MKTRIMSSISCVFAMAPLLNYVASADDAQRSASESASIAVGDIFAPTGWMGDGEEGRKYIDFNGVSKVRPHSKPSCVAVKYTFGPKRWAGIYWQNRADNWGEYPGNNYSRFKITRLTFWARGERGGEVVEFKAGDIKNANKKYQDSFAATLGRVTLTNDWKRYSISLENEDLSNVIGGFCWVASADFNENPSITFYLDDIDFE